MLEVSRLKLFLAIFVCAAAFALALPNFISPETRAKLGGLVSDRTMNLGLDLRGGSYLLLEVGFDEYVKEQMELLVDDVRVKLREEKIGYKGLGLRNGKVSFTLRDVADADAVKSLVRKISAGIIADIEGDVASLSFDESYLKTLKLDVTGQSIETVRRRVDETGTREPTIQRQGDLRILLQVPGLDNPEHLKSLLGRTAKMTFHLMDENNPFPSEQIVAPPGAKLLEGTEGRQAGQYYLIKSQVVLGGDSLVNAGVGYDDYGSPAVNFRFNNQGGRKFAEVTGQNVGKPFAIVLDGKVITAPVINEPILGGSGVITGKFSVQEANDLSLLLRSGALPAPLKIIEERTVGPSLGQDSIDAGSKAAAFGVIFVVIAMVLFYGIFGMFANIALIFNLAIIIAVLSLFEASLTLPGIAGLVLTMGMAVDANVLIFERMKEEMRLGRSTFAAVDYGFRQAFATIFDSNITTLIATFLLFIYGSGPIKGFAVTLSVGILSSMFTAITLTKIMIIWWMRAVKPKALPL